MLTHKRQIAAHFFDWVMAILYLSAFVTFFLPLAHAQIRAQTDDDRISLSPYEAIAGEEDFILTVYGINFTPNSIVRFNEVDETTVFVNETVLIANIPATAIQNPGNFEVSVFNPPPGGGESNKLIFVVHARASIAAAEKIINELRANPEVVKTVKKVAFPASVTIEVVSAGTLTVTATVGSAAFAVNVSQLLQQLSILRFYALGLLRFRRKKPWGRVINKFTGKPIRGAMVKIFDADFRKLRYAELTDSSGRFTALMPIGKYYIKATHTGFSEAETSVLDVKSSADTFNFELALSPELKAPGANIIKRLNLYFAVKNFLDLINPYLLALGTLISLATVIIVPTTLNYFGFIIYLLLDALKIYFALNLLKPFGQTLNRIGGAPVPLAIVRIFDEKNNFLLSTKVTDESGRFNFLLSPGKYYLTCANSNFKPFQSDSFSLSKSGLAAMDITLDPTP